MSVLEFILGMFITTCTFGVLVTLLVCAYKSSKQ